MQAGRKAEALENLRAEILGLERRPLLAGLAGSSAKVSENLFAAIPGLLSEVYTDEQRNAGAALGFALGMARGLLGPERPAILVMQLTHEAQELGVPYGVGLGSFGVDPETIILGRTETVPELLWAVEEAISCRAVAAVVADVGGHPKALDFTASRRLSLRAGGAGTALFILRYGRGREASAAQFRWRLMPAPSATMPFDPRAPGSPRWRATLEKGRPRRSGQNAGMEFLLDWTRDGFDVVDDSRAAGNGEVPRAAPPGAPSPALGHRLSQAG